MDCLICRIVSGALPKYTVYEDPELLAFLDIHPHAMGHTVVVPKRHAETLLDLDDADAAALNIGVKRSMDRIREVLKPDGFSVGWNHGEAGGQVVPHLHVHIFPRWKNDGGGNFHSVINNPGSVAVSEIAKRFASLPL